MSFYIYELLGLEVPDAIPTDTFEILQYINTSIKNYTKIINSKSINKTGTFYQVLYCKIQYFRIRVNM